jgi:broad specificity phosphatase PhoE
MAEAGTGPDSVIVSPMLRALETAKPILAATKAVERGTAHAWPAACECGGIFAREDDVLPDGKPCHELTRSEIQSQFPGVQPHESITEGGWWNSTEKETHEESVARCMAACKVMRGWADTGAVKLPSAERFADMRAHMLRRLECQRDGKPFAEEDVAPFAHEPDPVGTGSTDADVADPDADAPGAAASAATGGADAGDIQKGGEESHPGPVASVAVVCHHDFIDKSIALLVSGDSPPPSGGLYSAAPTLHFCFNNCSVSIVDLFPGGTTRVVRVNDVRHLDPVYTKREGLLSGFWQDPLQSPPEAWDGEEDDEFEGDLFEASEGGAAP